MKAGAIAMHGFDGNLLIGGMKLEHLHGELEEELPDVESSEWFFAGRVILAPVDCECLQLGRRYRLELADGRAGQVVISRLEPTDEQNVIAEFQPQRAPNKPR
jgi:hypothetical protein